ncbi:MAG: anthranilate synthase component I family protein [Deltaproteobacteria bacterium]|nr:anthranilate synthase component I family protein [Deltaproteobacteria bacterium]
MIIEKLKVSTHVSRFNADTITPVGAYLQLRNIYPNTLLLESADYRGSENSFSFLCFNPLVLAAASQDQFSVEYPSEKVFRREQCSRGRIGELLREFFGSISIENTSGEKPLLSGFFGYMAYDAIQYFEEITFEAAREPAREIPDLIYGFYRNVVAIDHFKNEMFIMTSSECNEPESRRRAECERLFSLIALSDPGRTPFTLGGAETSNFDDHSHSEVIVACKRHILRGDVFQIVTSRRFSQPYRGDDFNVYRTLRSINPSPYLFYFDYGSFRIFGSSPEAQLQIKGGKASIYPIAGTYARSADRSDDQELANALKEDPKENAEHVMLVDLARNDLSKHCRNVTVETYKEVQFYSHVIHLVSKVSGELRDGTSAIEILGGTFPAGTLSGAPKYRAMQLIDGFERGNRGYYGGTIGYIGINGDCNQAIMIRSFLAKDNCLHYQAGAGVVYDSEPAKEVAEVRNKLGALRRAIELAAGETR